MSVLATGLACVRQGGGISSPIHFRVDFPSPMVRGAGASSPVKLGSISLAAASSKRQGQQRVGPAQYGPLISSGIVSTAPCGDTGHRPQHRQQPQLDHGLRCGSQQQLGPGHQQGHRLWSQLWASVEGTCPVEQYPQDLHDLGVATAYPRGALVRTQ